MLAAGEEILRACVEAGGVISGEHGIGTEKRDYMRLLFGRTTTSTRWRGCATPSTPSACSNPGKVLPDARASASRRTRKARGYDRVPLA